MFRTIALLTLASAVAVLAGCGGSSQAPAPTTTSTPTFKIKEFAGDGNVAPKPMPSFYPAAQMTTQRLGDLIGVNRLQIAQIVPRFHTNWFRIAPVSISATLLVTLQPTDDGDPDLFVMEGYSETYNNGASVLGFSNRVNSAGPNGVRGADGYIPDWVAFNVSNTYQAPTAQVAIAGLNNNTSGGPAHFTVECDRVFDITVDGAGWTGTLPQGSSHWVRFQAIAGNTYYAVLDAISGDPDAYGYANDSSGFAFKETASNLGLNWSSFPASQNATYYVRIYGYSATPSQYHFSVSTTPPT